VLRGRRGPVVVAAVGVADPRSRELFVGDAVEACDVHGVELTAELRQDAALGEGADAAAAALTRPEASLPEVSVIAEKR
jgi:hypothetical protein